MVESLGPWMLTALRMNSMMMASTSSAEMNRTTTKEASKYSSVAMAPMTASEMSTWMSTVRRTAERYTFRTIGISPNPTLLRKRATAAACGGASMKVHISPATKSIQSTEQKDIAP